MLKKNVEWLLALLSLMLPLFYMTGYFYDRGYIESYGLEYSGFTKDVSYYLVNNVMLFIYALDASLLNVGATLKFFAVSIIYFAALGLFINPPSRSPNRDPSLFQRIQVELNGHGFLPRLTLNTMKIIKTVFIFVGVVAYVVYFAALSYDRGRHIAEKEMEEPLTCMTQKMSCAYAPSDSESSVRDYLGRIVANNESDYVIWDGAGTILYPRESTLKISIAK